MIYRQKLYHFTVANLVLPRRTRAMHDHVLCLDIKCYLLSIQIPFINPVYNNLAALRHNSAPGFHCIRCSMELYFTPKIFDILFTDRIADKRELDYLFIDHVD